MITTSCDRTWRSNGTMVVPARRRERFLSQCCSTAARFCACRNACAKDDHVSSRSAKRSTRLSRLGSRATDACRGVARASRRTVRPGPGQGLGLRDLANDRQLGISERLKMPMVDLVTDHGHVVVRTPECIPSGSEPLLEVVRNIDPPGVLIGDQRRVREGIELRFGDLFGPPASIRAGLDAGLSGRPEATASALKIVLKRGISAPTEYVGKGLEALRGGPDLGGDPAPEVVRRPVSLSG